MRKLGVLPIFFSHLSKKPFRIRQNPRVHFFLRYEKTSKCQKSVFGLTLAVFLLDGMLTITV